MIHNIIYLDIKNRVPYYTFFTLGCLILSIFIPMSFLIFVMFILLMRINHICCNKEFHNGLFQFYFMLPISRKDVVLGKNISLMLVLIITMIGVFIGSTISNDLGFSKVTEGLTSEYELLFPYLGILLGSILLTNIQYFYFILPYDEIISKNRIMIFVVFVLMIVFIQVLNDSTIAKEFINLLEKNRVSIIMFSILYFLTGTYITSNKVEYMDCNYD